MVVDGFAVVVGESFVVTIGFSVDDTIRIEIVLREMLCMFFGSPSKYRRFFIRASTYMIILV